MKFLIDGHNLISALPDISLEDEHDEAKLVEKLKAYCGRVRKKADVIFDHGLPGGQSFALSTGQIKVVFAAAHRTNADALIKNRIRRASRGQYTVVTSDQDILQVARRHFMPAMTSEMFAGKMTAAMMPVEPDDPVEEVYPNESEVDEWLHIFGGTDDA